MAIDRDAAVAAAEHTAHTVIDLITPVGLFNDKAAKEVHTGLSQLGSGLGEAAYDAEQAARASLSKARKRISTAVSQVTPVAQRSATDTVRGVQRLLQVLGHPNLKVDGIVGPRTLAALKAIPAWGTRTINDYVVSKGFTAQGLLAPIVQTVATQAPRIARTASRAVIATNPVLAAVSAVGARFMEGVGPFSVPQLDTIINRAKADAPAPVRNILAWLPNSDVISKILIESGGKADAVSRSGAFHGLLQLGRDAWSDAQRVDAKLPSFVSGRHNAYWNVRAALAFWATVVRAGNTVGIKIDTWEKLYAAHQQGTGGFKRLVQSKATPAQIRSRTTGLSVVDNQSRPSLDIVARAVEQVRSIA